MGERILAAVAAMSLAACGTSTPAPESQAPQTTSIGLSLPFQAAAVEARKIIVLDLGRSGNTASRAALDAAAATASERVQAARDLATTPADKDVALLLALLLVKKKDSLNAMMMTRLNRVPIAESIAEELHAAPEKCDAELRGWLFDRGPLETLTAGPCLAEARQAGDILGVR